MLDVTKNKSEHLPTSLKCFMTWYGGMLYLKIEVSCQYVSVNTMQNKGYKNISVAKGGRGTIALPHFSSWLGLSVHPVHLSAHQICLSRIPFAFELSN